MYRELAYTGKYTGRSVKDKFTVKDPITAELVNWGDHNQPFDPEKFDALFERVVTSLRGKELFAQDLYAGADPAHRVRVRMVTTGEGRVRTPRWSRDGATIYYAARGANGDVLYSVPSAGGTL